MQEPSTLKHGPTIQVIGPLPESIKYLGGLVHLGQGDHYDHALRRVTVKIQHIDKVRNPVLTGVEKIIFEYGW